MIGTRISEAIKLKKAILNDKQIINQVEYVITLMIDALKQGNGVYFCGNGGSAADAQHLSAELAGKFYLDRAPLKAEAISINNSFLTAVSNDYDFEKAYARAVEAYTHKGDVLCLLSTSGNSENIVAACQKANQMGVVTVAFTGANSCELEKWANVTVKIPSTNTPRIQEAHMLLGHIICEHIEKSLFEKS